MKKIKENNNKTIEKQSTACGKTNQSQEEVQDQEHNKHKTQNNKDKMKKHNKAHSLSRK